MNLRIAIVGLPNAGKSTLFNALLKKQVAFAANYPFATIEPNIGVVPVPDERLAVLQKIIRETERDQTLKDTRSDPAGVSWPPVVPATVQFVDVAGLVKGASEGQGLGNKFLSHIRETHLVVHVLRFFEDRSVVHVAGEVDPGRDADIIETELILADLQTLAKQQEPRGVKDKTLTDRWQVIRRLIAGLNDAKPGRVILTDLKDRDLVSDLHLLTLKPVLFVHNVDEKQLTDQRGTRSSDSHIAICAKTESELASLTAEEQKAYLGELGLAASGLDRLIQKAYEFLGLISFLTAGVKEVRAWTIPAGETAQAASGAIHTDFVKHFIKADVVTFSDFVAAGGWAGAREQGKARSEGREYIVRDGDVIEFKIGV